MNKRELIFKTALPLFDELGFSGTTTAKIAKEAGIGSGTLFLYFQSKEELLSELYFEIKEEMIQAIKQNMDESQPCATQMRSIWNGVMYWGVVNQLKFSFLNQFSYSQHFRNLAKSRSAVGFDYLAECFAKMLANPEHVPLVLTAFYGQIFAMVYHIIYHDESIKEVLTKDSFDIFWNGIKHLLKD